MNANPTTSGSELAGKRVTVMGLGRFGGGVGVAKFLAARGADVLVTDTSPADELKESVAKLAGLPIRFRLGEHREEDFTRADLVVVNPAVPPDNKFVKAAKTASVRLTSEIRLLVQSLPNRLRTIGITGSAGKSTTTAMVGHILRKQFSEDRVHVGGNIGGSLLGEIEKIRPDDWVVLELSSFMLEGLREDRWSPHIALITNFSPNHLDWHGTVEAYRAAKQAILDFQRNEDADAAFGGAGVHDIFVQRIDNYDAREADIWGVSPPIPLLIPGQHNQTNARLASEVVRAATGTTLWDSWGLLADFPGLPHRLQFVCEHAGVRYYNDSKSTTPESARLGLESFPPGVVHAILGGYDKKSDLASLAKFAAQHCRAIYTVGVTGDAIGNAAESSDDQRQGSLSSPARRAEVVRCGTVDHAVMEIVQRVRRGDVVLLSPACASWDQFTNYEARGAAFIEAVLKYTGEGAPLPKA